MEPTRQPSLPSHPTPHRLGRAAVFATVCTALALVGHLAVSGRTVAPWTVGAGCAAMTALAMLLAGHERSLPTIMSGLFGGQFVLHVLFVAGQTTSAHQGMVMAAHAPGSDAIVDPAVHSGAGMTSAHYAAAVVAAWWLHRGEQAVWRLAKEIAALVASPARALLGIVRVTPGGLLRVPQTTVTAVRPIDRFLRHAVARRGPPLCSRVPSLG
jgi:hypothetical protein